ncbi:APC family permease [Streptomyces sp. NP160]|uniref:APC family permease n=1 Tax=Streptomyces sp. NP160 TaxID=2586637 RepID=UPI001119302B|nr:APC family permease [Streptomyces sp. NP160]TNM61501.1 APC family permease [Streptomyces sp. NP160]
MATTSAPPSGATTAQRPERLTGRLGVGAVVFMVVAAAAPLTVVAGAVPIGIANGNGAAYPAMFAVSAVVLALFAVGFTAMTRHVPNAGAFYSYIGVGLGRGAGLGSALVALISYVTVQCAVYAYLGYATGELVASWTGASLPWWAWAWALAGVAVAGWLGFRHIELSGRVLGVLLLAEIGIVLALDAAVVLRGGAEGAGLSTALVEPSQLLSGAPGLGLMFAVAGFIGFEATAVFRDEARDPDRTIPVATYVALALIGVFYTLSAWAVVSAFGDAEAVQVATADPGSMVAVAAQRYLGTAASDVLQVLLLTSLFAAVLSFHNVLARYAFSLARARVLPAAAGASHARHGSPHVASLATTAVGAAVLVVCALAGLDPVMEVFTWLSGVATVGIIALMLLTCIAVLVFFRRARVDRRPWNTLVAPALGLLGLGGALALVVVNLPLLMGGSVALGVGTGVLLLVALGAGWVLAAARPAAAAELLLTPRAEGAPQI